MHSVRAVFTSPKFTVRYESTDIELESQTCGIQYLQASYLFVSGQTDAATSFEVAIGIDGEDKHQIRKGLNGSPVGFCNCTGKLSCDEHTNFWISWTDSLTAGYIYVGSGTTLHEERFMSYDNKDGPISIGAYSVASEDENTADFRLGTAPLGE